MRMWKETHQKHSQLLRYLPMRRRPVLLPRLLRYFSMHLRLLQTLLQYLPMRRRPVLLPRLLRYLSMHLRLLQTRLR
jgi:hypothetical protein